LLHLVQQSVNPRLSLPAAIRDWPQIARELSESTRQRKRQKEIIRGLKIDSLS
jgi:hypothetical protein